MWVGVWPSIWLWIDAVHTNYPHPQFINSLSIIGLVFSLLIIFIIVNNRQCHTVNKLPVCDLYVALSVYLILNIVRYFSGLGNNWYSNQSWSTISGHCIMVLLAAIVVIVFWFKELVVYFLLFSTKIDISPLGIHIGFWLF